MNSQDTMGAAGTPQQQRDYTKRTDRERAYLAIDSEREYQDKKYGTQIMSHPGIDHQLIISFAKKLDEAHGTDQQQEIVREIAGICVRSLEQHGAPLRAT